MADRITLAAAFLPHLAHLDVVQRQAPSLRRARILEAYALADEVIALEGVDPRAGAVRELRPALPASEAPPPKGAA